MTDRAHLYRVITDAQGNVNTSSLTVSVFQPGTTTLISDLLYASNAGSTGLTNPFVVTTGIVDFFLVTPQRVDLKVDDGAHSVIYSGVDVLEVSTGGFDPNADPVVIGAGASAPGGVGDVAIGSSATTRAVSGTALGDSALADGDYCISIGYAATTSFEAPFTGSPGTDNIAVGRFSAAGTNGGASNAVAIGHSAFALPEASIAIGSGATASEQNAIAIGSAQSIANYDLGLPGPHGSTAIGNTAYVNAPWSVAIGSAAQVYDSGSQTVGFGVALGQNSFVDHMAGTALGWNANATANSATSVGTGAVAQHTHSTALGAGATTTAANQIMLGTTSDFVEIPGNGASNGLVLKDTATGTRYLIRITNGVIVLSAAP